MALAALGFAAWRMLVPADAGCQQQAWDVTPAAEDLPAGWIASASQYDIDRKTMSFLGPTPQDEASSQAVVYATVTCFRAGAEDAVTRSQAAAEDAGQSVVDRDDLGEQAYSAVDESGAAFLQLRDGQDRRLPRRVGRCVGRRRSTSWPRRSTRRSAVTAAPSRRPPSPPPIDLAGIPRPGRVA